jgi:HD superfamily phosphohydrolase YqeK
MVMMKNTLDIISIFPELSLISDSEIRAKTLEVWKRMWELSNFATMEEVPVTPKTHYPHIIHNRAIVQMAIKVADVLEKCHGIKVDRDFLISSALLQDASKLVEYMPTEGGYGFSSIGEKFQHGLYSAHIALEVGLPDEIVQAILTHTFDNPTYPPTLIAKILFYVDQIDMAALEGDRWKKMSVVYR